MATLNENIDRIENAKIAIKDAIVAKGVAVDDTALIDTYASKIGEIPTGGATPTSLDYGAFGYTTSDPAFIDLQEKWAYTKQKYDEWNPTRTSAYGLYQYDEKLVYAPLVDTQNVTEITKGFKGCTNLTTVPLLDLSKNTDCFEMFDDCKLLTSVPLFNTSKVTCVNSMFWGCSSLTTVPAFDLSFCTDCCSMFNGCTNLTEVPSFDLSKSTNCGYMFGNCKSLTSIPSFDLSFCTTVSKMFEGCSSLTTIPTNLTTSKVEYMEEMFSFCKSLIEIGEMDCSSVKAGQMFKLDYNNKNLTTLGGFKNLKVSLKMAGESYGKIDKITKQSLMNVINDLGQADPAYEAEPKLTVCSKVYGYLTPEDIKIATDKGWSIIDAGF